MSSDPLPNLPGYCDNRTAPKPRTNSWKVRGEMHTDGDWYKSEAKDADTGVTETKVCEDKNILYNELLSYRGRLEE